MRNFTPILFALSLSATAEIQTTFSNPLYQGEDPWVVKQDQSYYVCTSGPLNPTAVYVSKSPTLLDRGEKIKVWEGAGSYNRVFAPELHFVRGKWYIYFCADAKSHDWKHMAVVLESKSENPLDGFIDKGILFTGDDRGNQPANDITVTTIDGQLYAFWGSLGEKGGDTVQMAKMESPVKISENRKSIAMHAEGPRFITAAEKLIMTGAPGQFASKNYHLTGIVHEPKKGQLSDPLAWRDLGTLLESTDDVWGPSRASFTTSANGSENWVMYHSKIFSADDNGIREVNIQKFTFNDEGFPFFGKPISPTISQPLPAGDPGLGEIYQAEEWKLTGDVKKSVSHKNFTGTGYLDGFAKPGDQASFTVTTPAAGPYRLITRYANGVDIPGERQSRPQDNIYYPPARSSLSLYINGTKHTRADFHRTSDWNTYMIHGETISLNAGENTITWRFDLGDNGEVTLDHATVSPSATSVHGITGNYYKDRNLTELAFSRLDPGLTHNWGEGSPDSSIGKDNFSIRWQGKLEVPESGEYTFHSTSDNGIRLKIGDQLVLERWTDDYDKTDTGTITLEAGKKYPITYEYYEVAGGANTQLDWSTKTSPRQPIPQTALTP